MKKNFHKLHSLGNDFVIVLADKEEPLWAEADRIRLADRYRGIGYDQLLWIDRVEEAVGTAALRIFNSDGSESGQCVNGLRCAARVLDEAFPRAKGAWCLETNSGIFRAQALDEGYALEVDAITDPERIPFLCAEEQPLYALPSVSGMMLFFGVVSMGNPHAVLRLEDLPEGLSPEVLESVVLELSRQPIFPAGVNVGVCEIVSADRLKLRVYERGAGWTQACGSGACAAAVVAALNRWICAPQVMVEQPGGCVEVAWRGHERAVRLSGPVDWVFDGCWRNG